MDKPTLEQMADDLKSINRDPTRYRYYYIGRTPAMVVRGNKLRVEMSPESEVFVDYTYNAVYKIRTQFFPVVDARGHSGMKD